MFPNGAEFCLSLRPAVEMCTNFPYWTSQWNHLKGALDDDSKHYVLKMHEVARSYGVPLYFLLVGSSLEDPDIDYLKQLVAAGHEVGNHTYTHLNVKAKTIESLQAVYANAPWRAHGRTPLQVIHDEVRATIVGVVADHADLGVLQVLSAAAYARACKGVQWVHNVPSTLNSEAPIVPQTVYS